MHNRALTRTICFSLFVFACSGQATEANPVPQNGTDQPASIKVTGKPSEASSTRTAAQRKSAVKAAFRRAIEENRDPVEASPELDGFLADCSIPAADRYEVRVLAQQGELKRAKNNSQSQQLAHRARHARQLVSEFPSVERASSYFLQVAAAQPPATAKQMAEEFLRGSSVSPKMKAAAARLVAQCDSLGKTLSVPGLDLTSFRGRPVVIYTWSVSRLSNLETVKKWAKDAQAGFIAINVDADSADARTQADALSVPGLRYYEPLGLDGVLASQLNFTSRTSIYIVDQAGVLVDVKGFEGLPAKLARLAAKEARK